MGSSAGAREKRKYFAHWTLRPSDSLERDHFLVKSGTTIHKVSFIDFKQLPDLNHNARVRELKHQLMKTEKYNGWIKAQLSAQKPNQHIEYFKTQEWLLRHTQ